MRRVLTSPLSKGALGAILGGIVWFVVLHAWADHTALHAVAQYLNERAADINKLAAPAALAPPTRSTPATP